MTKWRKPNKGAWRVRPPRDPAKAALQNFYKLRERPALLLHQLSEHPVSYLDCMILEGRYHADLRVYIEANAALSNAGFEDFEPARQAFEESRRALNEHRALHDRGLISTEFVPG